MSIFFIIEMKFREFLFLMKDNYKNILVTKYPLKFMLELKFFVGILKEHFQISATYFYVISNTFYLKKNFLKNS